jgi:hypothetical protein
VTEPASNSAPEEPPAEVPSPPAEQLPFAKPELPYIKRMPSRRRYDLQLLVPFLCVGASIGTLALSTGVARHVALLFAFLSLFCWIRAGLVTTERAHTNWLLAMWGAVALFVGCGLISRLLHG